LIFVKRLTQLVQNFGTITGEPFGLEPLVESLVEINTQKFPQTVGWTKRLVGYLVTIIVGLETVLGR
jgi:hypothetical protein